MKIKRLIRKKCECGCGEYVNEGRRFIHGHNTVGVKKYGPDNNRYGTKHSAETIKKMRKAQKGKALSREHKDAIGRSKAGTNHPFYGKERNHETRTKCSIANSGDKHWNWQGGKSTSPYCCVMYDPEWRKMIFERDNYECQNPDCWGTAKRLGIHHIDHDKNNCSPECVISLCTSCNSRANGKRDGKGRGWWKKHYEEIMERRGYGCKRAS